MPELDIEVDGLGEITRRMRQFPNEYRREARRTMQASLLTLQERVPPYPPQLPGSSYRRTGQLGRSLGASMQGARFGQPDVADIRHLDGGNFEGTFGTNLQYAPRVIGESSQQRLFRARGWWTMKTIRDAAEQKIRRLWQQMADDLAAWLDR